MVRTAKKFVRCFVLLCICSVIISACNERRSFTITSDLELGETVSHHPTVNSIEKAFRTTDVKLSFEQGAIKKEADIINLINQGEIDIGIVKNDVEINAGFQNVRTLLPLFPDVLLILSRQDSVDLQSLFANGKAAVILDKIEEFNVIEKFLKKNGTRTDNLSQVHAADSSALLEALNDNDILILFASLNSQSVRNILRSWDGRIFSLDDPSLIYKGSIVDGFCMAYPKAIPFIVPKGTYGRWPLEPVLTFAVYDVMICHKDLDEHVAYDMVKTIYDMRQSLSEENFEFGMLDDNIESHKFSFPLHDGAVSYMTRNQPTFWERESEVIGLIITIIVLSSGGLTTLYRHLKQRRKDRVDVHYQKAILVSSLARQTKLLEKKEAYLEELFFIRNNAFDQLVHEKLDANEAFTIFVNLLNASIRELQQEIETMKSDIAFSPKQ